MNKPQKREGVEEVGALIEFEYQCQNVYKKKSKKFPIACLIRKNLFHYICIILSTYHLYLRNNKLNLINIGHE